MKSIVTGVPQGSILGPFLFLLYINNLPSTCKNSKISLFADDTSVCNMNKNSENESTDDIQRITSWFKRNKLTVNTEKCESIGFRNALLVNESAFGQQLELKNSCKYLGLFLDSKLDFKNHIKMITKKLNRFCGLLYRIRELYPKKCLNLFCNSYAKPNVMVCWHMEPLQKQVKNQLKKLSRGFFEQCFSKNNPTQSFI